MDRGDCGVCWALWVVRLWKGRLSAKTKIALSHFPSMFQFPERERERGEKNKEMGGVLERELDSEVWARRDGEWRRGSPGSFVCSLMETLPPLKTETPSPLLLFCLFFYSAPSFSQRWCCSQTRTSTTQLSFLFFFFLPFNFSQRLHFTRRG